MQYTGHLHYIVVMRLKIKELLPLYATIYNTLCVVVTLVPEALVPLSTWSKYSHAVLQVVRGTTASGARVLRSLILMPFYASIKTWYSYFLGDTPLEICGYVLPIVINFHIMIFFAVSFLDKKLCRGTEGSLFQNTTWRWRVYQQENSWTQTKSTTQQVTRLQLWNTSLRWNGKYNKYYCGFWDNMSWDNMSWNFKVSVSFWDTTLLADRSKFALGPLAAHLITTDSDLSQFHVTELKWWQKFLMQVWGYSHLSTINRTLLVEELKLVNMYIIYFSNSKGL